DFPTSAANHPRSPAALGEREVAARPHVASPSPIAPGARPAAGVGVDLVAPLAGATQTRISYLAHSADGADKRLLARRTTAGRPSADRRRGGEERRDGRDGLELHSTRAGKCENGSASDYRVGSAVVAVLHLSRVRPPSHEECGQET